MTTRVLEVLGRSAGGIARHVADVVAALDGSDDFVVDVAGPTTLPVPMPKTVRPLDVPDGPTWGHLGAVWTLKAWVQDYDVVHAHGLRAGLDAGVAARAGRVRSLLTVHNLVRAEIVGPVRASLYRRAEAAAVWATDRTFAVSEDIARHLRASIPKKADSIEVMYLGIGGSPATQRSRDAIRSSLLLGNEKLIVTAARLAPQKSLEVMLRALHNLPRNVRLVVVGEGPLRRPLEERARLLGVDDRVRFLGFRADAIDYIAAADAFCLSSVWEGIPLAAQEAILLGVPVVATDVGGMRELISNKVSGRLVPPGDAEALSAALEDVIFSGGAATRYAAAASEQLGARFSREKMLARLREAYAA